MYRHFHDSRINGFEGVQLERSIQPLPLSPPPPMAPTQEPSQYAHFDSAYNRHFAPHQSYVPTYGQPLTPVHGYITNPQGLPVNLSHGAIVTESRGVFIGNLPYNTQWKDLKEFFQDAGRVIRCDVPQGSNGRGKGHATILFETPSQAERACELFDGSSFMGRPLRVRIDKFATRKSTNESSYVSRPGRY